MIAARAFAGKHYAVYGLARWGGATGPPGLARGAWVTAWHYRDIAPAAYPPPLSGAGAGGRGVEIADLATLDLTQFDSLVLSPGVPLNTHPLASRARDSGVEIVGDIELFARARPELLPHQVVGITGTNGKSTTTALVHHILQTAGVPSAMGGNIGLPILAQDPLPEGGIYVLELSSYQIDLTQSLDCDVAVLTNVTPDHLDRYASLEAYEHSKARLFAMQSEQNYFVSDIRDPGVSSLTDKWDSGPLTFRAQFFPYYPTEEALSEYCGSSLQGPHNHSNARLALRAVWALGFDGDEHYDALRTYPGLPHRMERVREKDRVLFVNDSKATNPTATAPALAAFSAIRWICGGQAKSDDLDECAPHFGNIRSAYTIGEAAELFARLLKPHMPVHECNSLENAVNRAAEDSHPGDTVLLSPACASFDQFRDFEARGDRFRELVGAL